MQSPSSVTLSTRSAWRSLQPILSLLLMHAVEGAYTRQILEESGPGD